MAALTPSNAGATNDLRGDEGESLGYPEPPLGVRLYRRTAPVIFRAAHRGAAILIRARIGSSWGLALVMLVGVGSYLTFFLFSALAYWPPGLRLPLLSQPLWSGVLVTVGQLAFAAAFAPATLQIAARERCHDPPQWAAGRKGIFASAAAGAIIAALALAAAMAVHHSFHLRGERIDASYFAEAVVDAPFAEEVYFRGLLQPAFARRLGPVVGCIIVTAISSLMHLGNALRVLPCMALLGLIRLRTKSVPNCVVAHAAYNLCLALITWL